MNLYVTVGYAQDGKPKLLAGPELSYEEHKKILRSMDGKGYTRCELWSRSSGKIKQCRPKPKPDKKAKAKPENTENKEIENNEK